MEQPIYIFASLFVGLLVGAAAMGLVLRARISSAEIRAKGENQVEIARLNERLTASQEDNKRLEIEKENLAALRDQLIAERQRLSNQVAELTTALESERSQSVEKIELLKNAEEQLSTRFKMLASEILEDKTKRFTEQNKTNLDQLLEPLKVKITEFQGKVQEVYVQEGKDRSALAEQVKQLMALNNQLSKDA
ncbi:MAG TPA: DNA recombination protein RmuC, partial [Gallionella sp.]|nr:DNA recombination protein RmuC [Gallionella sp.]